MESQTHQYIPPLHPLLGCEPSWFLLIDVPCTAFSFLLFFLNVRSYTYQRLAVVLMGLPHRSSNKKEIPVFGIIILSSRGWEGSVAGLSRFANHF